MNDVLIPVTMSVGKLCELGFSKLTRFSSPCGILQNGANDGGCGMVTIVALAAIASSREALCWSTNRECQCGSRRKGRKRTDAILRFVLDETEVGKNPGRHATS